MRELTELQFTSILTPPMNEINEWNWNDSSTPYKTIDGITYFIAEKHGAKWLWAVINNKRLCTPAYGSHIPVENIWSRGYYPAYYIDKEGEITTVNNVAEEFNEVAKGHAALAKVDLRKHTQDLWPSDVDKYVVYTVKASQNLQTEDGLLNFGKDNELINEKYVAFFDVVD